MGICEMCGSENRLFKANIEGTIINVCQHCAKFGKVIASVHDPRYVQKMQEKRENKKTAPISQKQLIESIVGNYSDLIKKSRECLSLTQEDLAKKINEKESIIHKVETGSFEPNIILARKLERLLKIKLVEQREEETERTEKTKAESFTLGDFIKVR